MDLLTAPAQDTGETAGECLLRVSGVRKAYGPVQALRGVDLSIHKGEILGLLGPNGAGKTTLVSIVAGLVRPDAGSVSLGGIDVLRAPRAARRLIGLAPQETGVYPWATVHRNLAFAGRLAGLSGARLRKRVGEVADALDLSRLMDRLARNLSTGERRRVHTAMAMVHRPPLLLLDEPTVGADVDARRLLLRTLRDLAADGCAICYSTHYLPEIETLGAAVAIVDQGRIIARGGLAELIAAHSRTTLEVTFDGPAPEVELAVPVQRDGSVLRVVVPDPAGGVASTLRALAGVAGGIRSFEVIRPGLEGVYLALTGQRYLSAEQAAPEAFTGAR